MILSPKKMIISSNFATISLYFFASHMLADIISSTLLPFKSSNKRLFRKGFHLIWLRKFSIFCKLYRFSKIHFNFITFLYLARVSTGCLISLEKHADFFCEMKQSYAQMIYYTIWNPVLIIHLVYNSFPFLVNIYENELPNFNKIL